MFRILGAHRRLITAFALLAFLGTTAAAQQYPISAQRLDRIYFSDNFENGLGAWSVSGMDWGLTTVDSTSSVHSLTDSPGGNYVPYTNAAATLSQSLDLSQSNEPVLTFWHRYAMDTDYYKHDRSYAEISTDGGLTWTATLGSWNYRISTWRFVQIDLSAYKSTHVKIRFRLYSDSDGYVGDGWYVDDVKIAERDSNRLPFPFFEDFEGPLKNWLVSGNDWLRTSSDFRSGSRSLTDSVGANYLSYTSASATLAHSIDLSSTVQPVLSFWHRYALDQDYYKHDTLYVQVSTDGGYTWSTLLKKNYRVSTWHHVQLDLSNYRSATVKVRFHLYSDSDAYRGDGWYLDDVAIQEYADLDTELAFPFHDDLENGLDNWLLSGRHWDLTNSDYSSATHCLTDSPNVSYGPYASARATLGGTLDLTATDHPVLTFWQRYSMDKDYYKHDRCYVQVSADGGFSWTTLKSWNYRVSTWFFVQADLSAYKEAEVKVRFLLYSDSDGYLGDGWHIDDVKILEEADLNPPLPYPFADYFENGTDNWLLSGRHWELTTATYRSPTHCLTDSKNGNYAPYTSARATLDGVIDLSTASFPVLKFWHMHHLDNDYYKHDTAYVQISTDGGFSWKTLKSWKDRISNWKEVWIDLTPYIGEKVKIRFYLYSDSDGYLGDGWYVDDVKIEEL